MKYLIEKMTKLSGILHTVEGWVLAVALFFADYFGGHSFVCFLVAAVTLMDAVFGIWVSLRHGQFALSELGRLTVDKVTVYGCALFVFVGLDKFAETQLSASVVGSMIVLVEFWSSLASMLILFPHIPLLKLLKKALTGEIASKLRIDEKDVEYVLSEEMRTRETVRVSEEQVEEAKGRAGFKEGGNDE